MLLAGCDKYFSGTPTLKCLKANERAKRFYQSQGWRVRSEADGPEGPYFPYGWPTRASRSSPVFGSKFSPHAAQF